MPFDEDEEIIEPKVGLKKVSAQKSIFDSMQKKPSQEDLDRKVKQISEKSNSYKIRAAELVKEFNKCMADKTLSSNRNIFSRELETELLSKMIKLADEINSDIIEKDGMGSLSLITILLKTCFSQRDRINSLEYAIFQIEKKLNSLDLTKK